MTNIRRRDFLVGTAALAATSKASFAQTPPTGKLEIKIVNSIANNLFAFQELLNRKGYLEEFGVSATTVNVGDGVRVMAGLVSGDLDICMASGFGQVLPAIQRGGPVRIVAGANNLTPQGIMTNRANIKSMSDLTGKTLGVGPLGALEHQLTVAMLMKHKVDPASVKFVNIGATVDIYRAVVAGTIDAGPVNIDRYGLQKGDLKILADMWTDIPNYPYQGSFASTAAITKKREAIVRTLAAYCKLYRYLQTPESKGTLHRRLPDGRQERAPLGR